MELASLGFLHFPLVFTGQNWQGCSSGKTSTGLEFLICCDEFPIFNDVCGQGWTSNCFIGKIFILEDFLLKLVIGLKLLVSADFSKREKLWNYSVLKPFLLYCWIWKPQWGQLCFCWRQQSDCTELNYLHRQKKTTKKQGLDHYKMQCRGAVVLFRYSSIN